MQTITAKQIAEALDFPDFVEALRSGFRSDIKAPERHHHDIERRDKANSTMLLMPAWSNFQAEDYDGNGYMGVKIVNVSPDNKKLGKASIQAQYLLFNGETGELLAMIDGQALTFWRTSCASALASDYLSKKNSKTFLMIGSGALAPWLIKAHMAVRPIEKIRIWNRNTAGAENLVAQLRDEGIDCKVATDLQMAVAESDIISAATLSQQPIIKGKWLNAGTHVDLVGGFTPLMREADDEAIGLSSVFVDTKAGALSEAGDIVQPLANQTIVKNDILADLFDLTREIHNGRSDDNEITLFKSTGASLEDLVGAMLISERLG